MVMTFAQLRALAVSVGFAYPDTAAAVAMAESGGDPNAIGDEGTSYGLWQIHLPAHPQYDAASLLDPTYNAQAALTISEGGTVWTPWSTFNSGAYLHFLQPAPAAASTSNVGVISVGLLAVVTAAATAIALWR